jgi:hypothetical protein
MGDHSRAQAPPRGGGGIGVSRDVIASQALHSQHPHPGNPPRAKTASPIPAAAHVSHLPCCHRSGNSPVSVTRTVPVSASKHLANPTDVSLATLY